jgi:hypothetical protein
MTEEYTKIQLTRQDALTRLIQDRLAIAGEELSGGDDGGSEAAESPSSDFRQAGLDRRLTPDHPAGS